MNLSQMKVAARNNIDIMKEIMINLRYEYIAKPAKNFDLKSISKTLIGFYNVLRSVFLPSDYH